MTKRAPDEPQGGQSRKPAAGGAAGAPEEKPSAEQPAAGPHAKPELTNPESAPGAGTLPDPEDPASAPDSTSG